jgi:hypothetical protein
MEKLGQSQSASTQLNFNVDVVHWQNKSLNSVIFPFARRTTTFANGMKMTTLFYFMIMPSDASIHDQTQCINI